MSKKFFAKYLAVEGEIKEGDLYLQNLVGIGFLNEIRTYTGGKLEARDKKVKLFLCSRDIQVGDKLYPLEGAEDQHEGAEMTCLQDVTVFKRNKAFKVIGQISPEATWVKEGDEFVEDEIFLSKYGSNWDNKKPLSQKYTAFIKGSCGHFH